MRRDEPVRAEEVERADTPGDWGCAMELIDDAAAVWAADAADMPQVLQYPSAAMEPPHPDSVQAAPAAGDEVGALEAAVGADPAVPAVRCDAVAPDRAVFRGAAAAPMVGGAASGLKRMPQVSQ